jgi:hypothetical protein
LNTYRFHPCPLPGRWSVVVRYAESEDCVHPAEADPLTSFYYWVGYITATERRVATGVELWHGTNLNKVWDRPDADLAALKGEGG